MPRGAGTGLAGGAIPLGAPIVVALTRMNRILEVDLDNRVAWVEPGVVNLDLTRHLAPLGFHFAPDPSSQQVCTIGGNVANNSGGPHCLADGVTNAHVRAIEVVLPDGEVAMLGGLDAEPLGLDLRGVFVGGEGTLGIATRIAVTITKNRPAVRTLLLSFDRMRDAANTVSAVIAAGIVPAAMEVMDQRITVAVENYVARRLSDRRRGRAAGRGRRPRRRRRDRRRRDRRDRSRSTARPTSGSRRAKPSGSCCGRAARRRSGRSPRSRPTTTSTTPSCPDRSWPRCSSRSTRSPSVTT